MVFIKNTSFGEKLREARKRLRLAEREIAGDLRLPVGVIRALEDENAAKLPARVYSRNFLRVYAEYLGLDPLPILNAFDEIAIGPRLLVKQKFLSKRFSISEFLDQQKIISIFSLAILLMVGLYFVYEFRFVIHPPKLLITEPAGDIVTGTDTITISGRVEKESILTLNGRPIYTSEQGEFRDSALLAKGLNILEFEAKNRFGKINKAVRYILVK